AGGFRRWRRLLQLPDLSESLDASRMAGATRIHCCPGSIESTCSGSDGSVLRLWKGLSQPEARQPSRGSVPLLRLSIRVLAGSDRPVLPGQPTTNVEARQLRQVCRRHRANEPTRTPEPLWAHRDRGDQSEDELSEAV